MDNAEKGRRGGDGARAGSSLDEPRVAAVLNRLHEAAKSDRWRFLAAGPTLARSWVRGRGQIDWDEVKPHLKDAFLPVSREQGKLLYLLARTLGAKRVVEFGTSFGISTIYLAAGVRDNGGEKVIGSELEPTKWEKANQHLREAGLAEHAEVRLGDALKTLADVPAPVDMVLIDGWKDIYLDVLKLLTPKLRPGSVVLADNIFTFKRQLTPYVEYVQSGRNGFQSTTLSIADGFEYSLYTG